MKTLKIILLLAFFHYVAAAQRHRLSKAEKASVISNICTGLKANYIFLDTAENMGRYIQEQQRKGAYDTITTPSIFASRLTNDLLSVYHDGHLSIYFDPGFTQASGQVDTAAERARLMKFRKRVNFGFDKAEILPGNIGYLKIGGFFAPDSDAKAMTLAAFRFVSNSNALIIDLRENHGGDPGMVSYICGLLFNTKTHLNDLYTRKDESLQQFWAIPRHEIPSLEAIPIYILTGKETFSAGEELSYDLQTQKRAIIIGEPTGGGAHPVQPLPVSYGFVANIPFARAINPITKTDWETIGVKPNVATSSADALTVALKMAMSPPK